MTATLVYYRQGERYIEQYVSTEEALKTAYWGSETGHIWVDRVLDDDSGEVVFKASNPPWREGTGENIFDFCESRDYDWVAEE